MLTTALALLLVCIAFTLFEVSRFHGELTERVVTLADVLANNCAPAIESGHPSAAAGVLASVRAEPNIASATVYDGVGRVFATYQRTRFDPALAVPPVQGESVRFEGGLLHVSRPIWQKGAAVGTIYLISDLTELPARLRWYLGMSTLVFLLALGAAFGLSSRLQRLISNPILQLAHVAQTIAREKNYSLRVTPTGQDELGQLVDRFNEMLAEIQQRDAALQAIRDELERRVADRTGDLASSISLLNATLESTADGILVVDRAGRVASFNRKFVEMWQLPREIVEAKDDEQLLGAVLAQLKDGEAFLAKVRQLYSQQEAESFDTLEFKDGRVFERYSQAQRLGEAYVGRVWCFRDVTERRRADEALRRMEELYRRAIAGAGAVPYSYDFRTRTYSYIGEGIERLIGYAPQEISPQLWQRIVRSSVMLGEAAGLDKAEAARRVKEGKIRQWRCDMQVVSRAGDVRWISDASVQAVDAAAQPIGSMGILEDITERKQAELIALTFSKLGQDLNSATSPDAAAEIIGRVSEDLFGWDAFWVKVYDAEQDQMSSLLAIDTVAGERRLETERTRHPPSPMHRRVLEAGAELILRDQPTSFLPGAVAFGNKSRPSASLMLAPIRYSSRIVGILSVQSYKPRAYTERDLVTLQSLADQCGGALERIRADEARRKSEIQFGLVWNASEDGMRLIDSNGIIRMVNAAFCRLTGKTSAELTGQPLSVVYSEDTAEEILRVNRARLAQQAIERHLETEVTLWNGKRLWLDLSNAPLELPGQPPLLLSVFRDITERKRAEAELQRMHRELVEASRQAGRAEVATSVLHNVGNVLNSVNTSAGVITERIRDFKASGVSRVAELLRGHVSDLAGFLNREGRAGQVINYLESLAAQLAGEQATIAAEAQALQRNVEHIKEIVAMQQGYARALGVIEVQAVAELVDDAVRMQAAPLARQKVRIERDYENLPPVALDRHKVLQILINLIRNAQQALLGAGGDRPTLSLQVRRVNEKRLRITVTDNGIGIESANLTRIFSHGFTTRSKGHGFGLHSGWLAAREMGGSLTVHSDGPGRGATFTLELPMHGQPKTGVSSAPIPPVAPGTPPGK